MTDDSRLIEFLDKCAALRTLPRDDRIRAGTEELRRIYDILPVLLGVAAHASLAHPNDDGKQWGRIDPETGVWAELDKKVLLAAGCGTPPTYWTAPDGRLVHVVHRLEIAPFAQVVSP